MRLNLKVNKTNHKGFFITQQGIIDYHFNLVGPKIIPKRFFSPCNLTFNHRNEFIISQRFYNDQWFIESMCNHEYFESISSINILEKFIFKSLFKRGDCFYKIPRNINVLYHDTKLTPPNIFIKYFLTKQIILPELSNIIFNDLLESIRLDIDRYPLIIL